MALAQVDTGSVMEAMAVEVMARVMVEAERAMVKGVTGARAELVARIEGPDTLECGEGTLPAGARTLVVVVTARAAVLRVMVERGAVVEQTGMLVEDTVATAVGKSSGQAVNALEVAMALTVADT